MPDLGALLIQADARHLPLRDESVQCVVTSPPYWGLRDYGAVGQLGLEATPKEYVDRMVCVFREVRRVLRPDGTLWLNLGDSYAGSGRGGNPTEETSGLQGGQATQRASMVRRSMTASRRRDDAPIPRSDGRVEGLAPKNLLGMPWRVAFALQADGWILRSEIIWHKPNVMPSSVTDRPTTAHEHLFLLAKSQRYFYDGEAIKEPVSKNTHARISQATLEQQRGGAKSDAYQANQPGQKNHDRRPADIVKAMGRKAGVGPKSTEPGTGIKSNESFHAATAGHVLERNKRTVWIVPTRPYPGAHFATFPEALVEPCIKAGSAAGDVVLDPFNGSGTTGRVALRLGRSYVGADISREYLAEQAVHRLDGVQMEAAL